MRLIKFIKNVSLQVYSITKIKNDTFHQKSRALNVILFGIVLLKLLHFDYVVTAGIKFDVKMMYSISCTKYIKII